MKVIARKYLPTYPSFGWVMISYLVWATEGLSPVFWVWSTMGAIGSLLGLIIFLAESHVHPKEIPQDSP